jgi:hypothetical protein
MSTAAPSAPAKSKAGGPVTIPAHWEKDAEGKDVWVEEQEVTPPPPKPVKANPDDVWVAGGWVEKDGETVFVNGHYEPKPKPKPFQPRRVRATQTLFYPSGPLPESPHVLVVGATWDKATGQKIPGEEFTLWTAESWNPDAMEEIDARAGAPPADVPMTTISQRASPNPQQRPDGTFQQHTRQL